MITKTERTELRSVTRQQFKVLRDEVHQREAELIADIEAQVADQYADRDKALSEVLDKMQELADDANRLLREFVNANEKRRALMIRGFTSPGATHRIEEAQYRSKIRLAAIADLKARVGDANVKLGRQEADLLRNLAIGALETDEARTFLTGIPTVGELVPASRLQEIEAGLGNEREIW